MTILHTAQSLRLNQSQADINLIRQQIATFMGFNFPLKPLEDDSWVDADGRAVPNFPNNISAAWQAVEHLKQHLQGVRLEAGLLTLKDMGGFYVATFGYPELVDDDWGEHADDFPSSASGVTAPLAICRAILKRLRRRGADF